MRLLIIFLLFAMPIATIGQCNFFDNFQEGSDFNGCAVYNGIWSLSILAQNQSQPYTVQKFINGFEFGDPESFVGTNTVSINTSPPNGESFIIEYLIHYGVDIASATCSYSHITTVLVNPSIPEDEVVQLSIDQGFWCSEVGAGQVTLNFPTPDLNYWEVSPMLFADNGVSAWPVDFNDDQSVAAIYNLTPGNYYLSFSSNSSYCYAGDSIPFSIAQINQPEYSAEVIQPFGSNNGEIMVSFSSTLPVSLVSISEGTVSGTNPFYISNLSGEILDINLILDGTNCEWNYSIDPTIAGCTNSAACNFNPLALSDDGSCSGTIGCMNESADNYNPNATCDAFCNFIADFNGDGAVNVSDLLLFTGGWSCSGDGCLGDLDNDNYVGSTDLLLFLSLFGEG
jgi:hypothetical protein